MGFWKRTRSVTGWGLASLSRSGAKPLAWGVLVLGAAFLLWALAPSIRGQQRSPQRLRTAKLNQGEREPENLVRLRQEWFFHQRAYPLGFIPAGLRERAIEQMNRIRQSVAESALGQVAPLIASTWMPIGPQPTAGPFFGNTSGRVTALVVDRCDVTVKTVYLGGADGGVWKTTDGGTTWTPLTDTQPSLAVGSIALDTSSCPSAHAAAIYVGTGEENFASDNVYGAGVLKSTDGGQTWTVFGASAFGSTFPLNALSGGPSIGALSVNPANSQILLAALRVRGSDSVLKSGIWRSTNGGANWTQVFPPPAGIAGTDVAFDPNDPTGNTAYAALGSIAGTGNMNGVYKSPDGGMTWIALSVSSSLQSKFGRIALAVGPQISSKTELFAAIADASTTSGALLGVFKSMDGGSTWTQLGDPLVNATFGFCNSQCFFDLTIRVSPTNANLVFAGGAAGTNAPSVLIRSTDGGNTFADVSEQGTPSALHVDTHALAFAPNGSFYTGNDGGVWGTLNPSAATIPWTNSNTGTLGITQFYPGHSFHPSSPLVSYGGTQDNGMQKYSGTTTWDDLGLGCDGGFTAVDTQVPSNVYGTCEYIPSQLLIIAKFFHDGDINSAILATSGIDGTDNGSFIPPLVIDHLNPLNLYFGTFRVWQTTDGGNNWQSISPNLTVGSGVLRTIAVAPSNSNVIYTGSNDGLVFVTNNATAGSGATWSNVTGTGLPNRVITHVVVDPHSPATVYVTFSGFSGFNGDTLGHVFKTIAGGTTWEDISSAPFSMSPVPNIPVNALVVDPDDPSGNTLYVGTDIGVFVTSDGGVHWAPLGSGLPTVEVLSLVLHEPSRTLRAATHGRSVWDFQLSTFTPSFNLASLSPVSANLNDPQTPLAVTGNGFTNSSTVQFNGAALTTSFVDANHLTATIPVSALMAAAAIPVTVKDASISNALTFTVLNPAPALNSISPMTATAEMDLSLTVNGTGFVNGTQVQLDGSGVPTVFNSATQVTANIPGPSLAQAGTHAIDVFSPQPGGGIETNFTLFLNVVNPVPAATQLMPTNVNAGSAGFTLMVNGSAFVPSSQIQWNGNPRTTTFVNTSQLTAAIPATDVGTSGTASVTVSNPAPGGGTSTPALTFTINQVGDFSFGPVSPSSRTVPAGQSAMYTIPVIGMGGFTGMVTISCASLPAATNCNSIVPNPVAAGSSTVMTIATTMRSTVPGAPSRRQRPWTIYVIGLLPAALFLLTLALKMKEARRRRLAFGLTIGLVAAFLALQIGCGGGGGGGGGGGTPAGPYTITIVGQSGALNHTTNVQLIVQ